MPFEFDTAKVPEALKAFSFGERMQQGQGRRLSQDKVTRIQRLLADTDMTINEIVERLGHSKAVILAINRRFGIREYTGRSRWFVNRDWKLRNGRQIRKIDREADSEQEAG